MPKWIKKPNTGRHIFRLKGKRVTMVPGNTITCEESLLHPFLDEYECLEKPAASVLEELEPDNNGLVIEEVEEGLFNVINPENDGKPLNDSPLDKEEANSFLVDIKPEESKKRRRVKKEE